MCGEGAGDWTVEPEHTGHAWLLSHTSVLSTLSVAFFLQRCSAPLFSEPVSKLVF